MEEQSRETLDERDRKELYRVIEKTRNNPVPESNYQQGTSRQLATTDRITK